MGIDLTGVVCPIVEAVDAAAERDLGGEDERTYLGASIIGHPCDRHLWYLFRWVFPPQRFSGRMLRLFRNGHRKEAEAVEDLRAAGMTVLDVDPATGKQFAVSGVGGHFRGHTDGQVVGVPGAEKTPHLFENKTHNAESFGKLVAEGIEDSKPEHGAQMCVYMDKLKLKRALYLARNKDDDAYLAIRVKADPERAKRLEGKAKRIITTEVAPAKIGKSADKWPCVLCPSRFGCHQGEPARRNCRTCVHSTPELDGDGRWSCARHGIDLDVETQRAGCPHHLYLPTLIPGEVIDADEAAETITYEFADGTTWTDGGEE